MSSSNIIEFNNIDFYYDHINFLFQNLSLKIKENTFLALLGKNGSGKSTLIKLLFNIEHYSNGEIKVLDRSIIKDAYEVYKNMSLVLQNPDDQIVSDIVELEVAFALENYGYSSEYMNSRIDEVLELVGLINKRKEKISLLSGGEKQRLCIASSLVLNPKILVLDEPTSMLDKENRSAVIDLLKGIHSKGTTIIIVTHHINEIEYCDDVLFIESGGIKFFGCREDFIFNLITNDNFTDLDLPINFQLAYELYKNKNVIISDDIFDYKKVCSILCKYL